jgi:hypothetical protein
MLFSRKSKTSRKKTIPAEIRDLLLNNYEFRNNIRAYNSALAFTSIGYNEDKRFSNSGSKFLYSYFNFLICHNLFIQ